MKAGWRPVAIASALILVATGPAAAWWHYAEWGMNASQLASASGGRTVPCRDDVPVCARPPGGNQPTLYVDGLQMVGMPAVAAFAFDATGGLNQTVVLFPRAELALIASLLGGIQGEPSSDENGVRVWRDTRRSTQITASATPEGTRLVYRPLGR